MFSSIRVSVLALFLTLLAGCAIAPAPTTEWQSHRDALVSVDSYTARGKVAFIAPNTRFSANLYWRYSPAQSQLRLTNFLGTTLLSLTMNEQGAVLIDDQGERYQDTDPARLVAYLTGAHLPIDALAPWLIGLPRAQDSFSLGSDNRVAILNGAQGWDIDYQDYSADTQPALPTRITLTRDQQTVKLMISDWTLDND
ncbi:lipoprotein insertase outer membrane protein LolB [Salinivibrio kushneri]|uniref:lipoprotein insertase outer membrane protein LolB n=1 Tax=Salinivibrio kushneri TaxID=1908198 RepID=UPI000985E325|nr:lipoprotein insertase outer membrane protein LolB [Salinivibrio kushneri]OOE53639.1 outer membrane lipoprotein LolB [Salinivibrio kushneri]OOE54548.1 outer membrane lipoprotein LolB [Salinivibrio kushneri]OOE63324.1 outer membrane lipoprotein LolB [Salinivibrio kushneri]